MAQGINPTPLNYNTNSNNRDTQWCNSHLQHMSPESERDFKFKISIKRVLISVVVPVGQHKRGEFQENRVRDLLHMLLVLLVVQVLINKTRSRMT